MSDHPHATPDDEQTWRKDPLVTRLEVQVNNRARLYGRICACACGCTVYHRFGEVCALCQRDDHWDVIAEYLDNVMRRDG